MSIRHILPSTGKQNSCRGTRLTIVDLSALAQRKETLDVAFGLTVLTSQSHQGDWVCLHVKLAQKIDHPKLAKTSLAWKGVGWSRGAGGFFKGPPGSPAAHPQSTALSHGDSESFSEPGPVRCAGRKTRGVRGFFFPKCAGKEYHGVARRWCEKMLAAKKKRQHLFRKISTRNLSKKKGE